MNQTIRHIFEQLREGSESEFVFTNPNTGKQLRKLDHSVRYMLSRLCEKVGVFPFGFHSLRHFVALRLRDQHQATGFEIQSVMGHQRISTTDLYLKGLKTPTRSALESLGSDLVPPTP